MHRYYYYSRPLFEKSESIKFKSIILNSIIERHHSGIAFQLHMSNSSDIIELDLPKHCTTKRFQPNIFGKLRTVLNHQRKFFKEIQATKRTCPLSEINVKCWTIGKALEFLYLFHLWNNTQRWNDKILFHFQAQNSQFWWNKQKQSPRKSSKHINWIKSKWKLLKMARSRLLSF